MTMSPGLSKFTLTAHVAVSVGLLGSVAGFLALAVAGLTSQNVGILRAAYVGMELIAWFVIVPAVFLSLLTGIVQSLGTSWGLFRHYWILAKLVVTIFVAIVLLLQMELIGYLADVAAGMRFSAADRSLGRSPAIHAAGGLLVLLAPVALSLYKPRGLTRYGWHKQHERQTSTV